MVSSFVVVDSTEAAICFLFFVATVAAFSVVATGVAVLVIVDDSCDEVL